MKTLTTLILSGGANRGIMYGGAIRCLEVHGLLKHIHIYVGTSVGAIFAAMLGSSKEAAGGRGQWG